jgi:hypothetical protein
MLGDSSIIIVDVKVNYNRLNGGLRNWIEQEIKSMLINRIYKTIIIKSIRILNEMTPHNCATMSMGVKVEILDSVRYNKGDIVEGVLNLNKTPISFYSGNLKCTFSDSSYTREMTNIIGKDNIKYSHGDKCKAIIGDLKYIHGNIFIEGVVHLFSKDDKLETS